MSKAYRFAQLYVRLARVLGILVFVGGLGLMGLRIFQSLGESNVARYRATGELEYRLDELRREVSPVFEILESKKVSVTKFTEGRFPELPVNASSEKTFEDLLVALNLFRVSIAELKEARSFR